MKGLGLVLDAYYLRLYEEVQMTCQKLCEQGMGDISASYILYYMSLKLVTRTPSKSA